MALFPVSLMKMARNTLAWPTLHPSIPVEIHSIDLFVYSFLDQQTYTGENIIQIKLINECPTRPMSISGFANILPPMFGLMPPIPNAFAKDNWVHWKDPDNEVLTHTHTYSYFTLPNPSTPTILYWILLSLPFTNASLNWNLIVPCFQLSYLPCTQISIKILPCHPPNPICFSADFQCYSRFYKEWKCNP